MDCGSHSGEHEPLGTELYTFLRTHRTSHKERDRGQHGGFLLLRGARAQEPNLAPRVGQPLVLAGAVRCEDGVGRLATERILHSAHAARGAAVPHSAEVGTEVHEEVRQLRVA
uniref:Uncharacterized protein n=1 Tax=Neobodo designis TaxID=312471 RepID=A0A7S1PM10_NEODS